MATTYSLTGSLADLLGGLSLKNIRAYVEASESAVTDLDTNLTRVGRKRIDLSADGSFVATGLPATGDARWMPTVAAHRLVVEYRDDAPGSQMTTESTNWFPLTANRLLKDVILADPNFIAAFNVTNINAAVTSAQSSATTAQSAASQSATSATAAQTAATQARDISNIAVPGDVMRSVDADDQSTFRLQQDARLAPIGAVNAASQSGGTVAQKITNASVAANQQRGIVVVPASLGTAVDQSPAHSDLVVAPGRTIIDYRHQVGSLSNFAVRAPIQYTKVFGDNTVNPPVAQSDSGPVIAIDALLVGGTGSLDPGMPYGETFALYTGTQRQAESTRSAWSANFLLTSYSPPSEDYTSMGLEIDINNVSGVDATSETTFDGLTVFTAGTNDARFGAWITSARSDGAGDGTAARWLDGVHISGVCKNAGLVIDRGQAAFDSENMLGIVCQPPVLVDDYVRAGSLRLTDARYWALTDYGAHVWQSTIPGQGAQTVGQLEANGKLTLNTQTGDSPRLATQGANPNVDLELAPKGAGNVVSMAPIRTAAYATGSRPSAATAGAAAMIYDTSLKKPLWSDGSVWRDATGTAA